jgi:hypothetical protein
MSPIADSMRGKLTGALFMLDNDEASVRADSISVR